MPEEYSNTTAILSKTGFADVAVKKPISEDDFCVYCGTPIPDFDVHHGSGVCEACCGCTEEEEAVTYNFGPPLVRNDGMVAKTQKAKGIRAMSQFYSALTHGCELWGGMILRDEKKADQIFPRSDPMFARPCPSRPRHGFVDSRVVKSASELKKVVRETLEADPEGEVIVGRYIKAPMSAILAGDRLVIGPGHDGATAGKDVIELGVRPLELGSYVTKLADIKGTAYVEIVYDTFYNSRRPTPTLVQLRDGPHLPPTASDYVPKSTTVKRVIEPCEDMLEWEKQVQTLGEGDVVWAPSASLASHAAIHCVANGIPFLTRLDRPAVGDVIESTDLASEVTLDYNDVLAGMEWASLFEDDDFVTQLVHRAFVASAVVHNWPYLRKWPVASRLIGAAAVGLAQTCAAICAGEARHYSLKKQRQIQTSRSRTNLWQKALQSGEAATYLADAKLAFGSPNWESGYGGPDWLEAATRTETLWNLVAEIYETGKVNEEKLIGALNACLNAVHNNGSLLSKLSIQNVLDGPSALTAVHAGPAIQEIVRYQPHGELYWCAVPERELPQPKSKKRKIQARVGDDLPSNHIKVQVWNSEEKHISSVIEHRTAAKILKDSKHTERSCAGGAQNKYVYLRVMKKDETEMDVIREMVKNHIEINYG